jgi:hypothetical protein
VGHEGEEGGQGGGISLCIEGPQDSAPSLPSGLHRHARGQHLTPP